MKLLELHIDGFGKFHDRTISLEDGINVIYGKNEAGKSTLHTFIRGMLFGIERGRGRASRNDLYSKFEPWENSGSYAGWIRLESNGSIYRIERKFRKEDRSVRIINETRGLEEEPSKALMNRILNDLNEITYNNTISIGQLKSATEDGMVSELKNYIANMNTTGNISLNITKATALLKNQKKELEAGLVPDASREYTALLAEIRSVDAEIASPRYENQLSSYQTMRSQVKGVIENTQNEKTALEEKINNARQVLEKSQFTGQASVTDCLERCEAGYKNYLEAQAQCKKRSRRILSALLFLLCAGCTGAAGYSIVSGARSLLPFAAVLGSAAVLFLVLGCLLTAKSRKYARILKENTDILSGCFNQYLGDPSVSEDAMTAFRARMAEFSTLCEMVQKSEEELKKHMEDLNSLQQRQNSCSEMIEKQQRTQWELEKRLEHLNNCKNQAAALKRVLAENDRIREQIAAIDLAQETMTELSSSIRDSFGLYLNKEASRLITGITGGVYDSMSIDESLNVFLNTRYKLVPIESVSSGTMDQVYLALRLAAAKLLQGNGEAFPLIFDDSFTQYDDERLRTALCWLAKACNSQMLIFTCHRREAQMLRANQIPFSLTEI